MVSTSTKAVPVQRVIAYPVRNIPDNNDLYNQPYSVIDAEGKTVCLVPFQDQYPNSMDKALKVSEEIALALNAHTKKPEFVGGITSKELHCFQELLAKVEYLKEFVPAAYEDYFSGIDIPGVS